MFILCTRSAIQATRTSWLNGPCFLFVRGIFLCSPKLDISSPPCRHSGVLRDGDVPRRVRGERGGRHAQRQLRSHALRPLRREGLRYVTCGVGRICAALNRPEIGRSGASEKESRHLPRSHLFVHNRFQKADQLWNLPMHSAWQVTSGARRT